jgi:serine protease DegS
MDWPPGGHTTRYRPPAERPAPRAGANVYAFLSTFTLEENMDALKSLSDSVAALAARASSKLFHVPSPMGGRTALGFDGRLLLVPASEAEAGDRLAILAPGGAEVEARVAGFDPGLGLAALELAEPLPASAWTASPAAPALGSLLLVAAYPSPEGPEVRLDALRFAGGEGEGAYLQTDGAPFPGFAGGALVDPEGALAGFLLADRGGNRGWALPASRAAALVAAIASGRSATGAWLGVSTVPIEAPPELAAAFGDGRSSALLVAGVQAESPAAKAGIQVGDIIASIGGAAVADPAELLAVLDAAKPGEELRLAVLRAGERKELVALPSARPLGRGSGGHHGQRREGGHHGGHGRGWGWRMGGGHGCGWAPGR